MTTRLQNGVDRQVQACGQRLDMAASRFSRPSHFITRQRGRLASYQQDLQHNQRTSVVRIQNRLSLINTKLNQALVHSAVQPKNRLASANMRLELLNPQLVLQRGYAWLASLDGLTIARVSQTHTGQPIRATLMDGQVDLTVSSQRLI